MMCLTETETRRNLRMATEEEKNNTRHAGRAGVRKIICITVAVIVALGVLYVGMTSVLCGMIEEVQWCEPIPRISLATIEEAIVSAGHWAVAVSIGLMILHSLVPFPAEFITIVNGMVWGPFWGLVITWTGAMTGAYLAFGLSRTFGQPFVARMVKNRHMGSFHQWLAEHEAGAVFISRFIPVISFNLINYAAGLTRMSWWTFTWATGLGILPITILMVVMGSRIQTLTWQGWALFLFIGLALWGMGHLMHRRFIGKAVINNSSPKQTKRSP
jgi:uncharacterized membrane protein YdjX (TVP38/TMEM64 family)